MLLKKVHLSLNDIAIIMALKNSETSTLCKEDTLTFLNKQIQALTIQAKFNQLLLDLFQDAKSIVSKSSGENDVSMIIELLDNMGEISE